MPVNKFLPFAAQPGSDVIDDTTYLNLGHRMTGFGGGILLSGELNRVLRQCSIMTYLLGGMINEFTGLDASDEDGWGNTLYPALILAIQKLGQGAANVQTIFGRTGAVVAQASDYAAFYDPLGAASAAQSAAIASAGAYTNAFASNASNITVGVLNPGLLGSPIAAAKLGTGIPATSIGSGIVSQAEFDTLDGVTANIQVTFNSIATALGSKLVSANFPFSGVSGNWSQTLVSGIIIKWGFLNVFQTATVAFNTPFPNTIWTAYVQPSNTTDTNAVSRLYSAGGFTFDVYNQAGALAPASGTIQNFWLAIGF